MTKTVGDIAINVTADIGPLTMAMKQGAESVEAMEKRTKAVGMRMKRFGDIAQRAGKKMAVVSGAMAAAATAAFALAKGTAESGREIVTLSKLSGASTDEFQRMAAASRSVGVEQDKLADILKDVNDKVGDFIETGGGPMADFFENIAPKVGVTAEQFKSLSGPDALQLYASSLQKANLSQSQMTFYMEALASDASALTPLLADNGSEMTRLGNAAAAAGAIMDGKALKASVQFAGQMGKLQLGLQGVRDKIGVALLPVALSLVTVLNEKVVPAMGVVVEKIGGMVDWFGNLSEPVQQAAGVIATAFGVGGPILVGVGLVSKAFGALVLATGPVGLFIAAATLAYTAWKTWGDDITALFQKVSATVADVFVKVRESIKTSISAIPQFFKEKMAEVQEFLEGLPAKFAEIGRNIVDGLKAGIMEKWESLKESILSLADSLPTWMRDQLGIKSPSRVFMEIGDFIGQGLAQGITASQGLVNTAVGTLSGGAVSGANEATTGVLSAMGSLFEGSKKISAGIALANSWLAFTEVLKDPNFVGRPWARVGAAFAALAPGLQAVKNIKSASIGGGSAGSGGGGAASTGGASQAPGATYYFDLQGETFGRETVMETLSTALQREVDNGGQVIFGGA